MGRPLPPGLSDPHRLALSQFFSGHLSAGQLSDRLQLHEQRSQARSERPANRPQRDRFMTQAALAGVVAAIAVGAVGFGIGSRPRVVGAHRAGTGRNQTPHRYGSGEVLAKPRTTSSPSRSSAVSGGEQIAVVSPSTSPTQSVHKAKAPRRKRHRFMAPRPKHPARPTATTSSATGAGGTTPPTATTSTSTTGPPSVGPPSGTTPSGGATASG